jgi:hypothetical protein
LCVQYIGTKRIVTNKELLVGEPVAVDVERKMGLGTLVLFVGEATLN